MFFKISNLLMYLSYCTICICCCTAVFIQAGLDATLVSEVGWRKKEQTTLGQEPLGSAYGCLCSLQAKELTSLYEFSMLNSI